MRFLADMNRAFDNDAAATYSKPEHHTARNVLQANVGFDNENAKKRRIRHD
jgi:hypothetical protein